MNDIYKVDREKMVELLRKKGISSETVLRSFATVKRELFVDEQFIQRAYDDNALPIICGQTISQPYTVAFMTECLQVYPACKVLEIGTGSGYQTAILHELGCDIYTMERIEELYSRTKLLFEKNEINVKMFYGDGSKGLPAYAPYERILVAAAAPRIPRSLANQLSLGGLMVLPIGSKETQKMTIVKRISENDYEISEKNNFRFVPLIGKEAWQNEQ